MNLYVKIFLAIFGLIIIWLIWTFNRLVIRRNRVDEAWADVDVQLKRRYNLIPNLIETVKAYARHESQTLSKVTEMRNLAMAAKTLPEHEKAEKSLSGALLNLFAVAENYPDLKASQNFLQLQNDLTDAEDKIQAARRFYNVNVRDFNNALQVFPNSIIAKFFHFEAVKFFAIENGEERQTPKVFF